MTLEKLVAFVQRGPELELLDRVLLPLDPESGVGCGVAGPSIGSLLDRVLLPHTESALSLSLSIHLITQQRTTRGRTLCASTC